MPISPATISVYDEVPYPSYPFPLSHPDRLAAMGILRGLRPAAVQQCRVLELGCGAGGNLLPLAETLPGSRFVGVDLSGQQIQLARQAASQLALANIEFSVRDVMDLDGGLGPFDYILCHGLYSWTTDAVRQKILAICRELLAPQGIAYVNYNTQPGWGVLGLIRDMLHFHLQGEQGALQRVRRARLYLADLTRQLEKDASPYAASVRRGVKLAQQYSDPFLFHAFLNVVNSPCYLWEFVERASSCRLRYLGDADPALSPGFYEDDQLAEDPPPHESPLQAEQQLDFLRETSSRQSLLCHEQGHVITRFDVELLDTLHVAGRLQYAGAMASNPEVSMFRAPSGLSATTADPRLRSVFLLLHDAWPETVPFGSVAAHAAAATSGAPRCQSDWRGDLCRCFARGLIEFRSQPISCSRRVEERPAVTGMARLQAKSLDFVTTLRHSVVRLDAWERGLLQQLDSQHTVEQLARWIEGFDGNPANGSPASVPNAIAAVNKTLERFADRSLLLRSGAADAH